jgi:hypothetical protein
MSPADHRRLRQLLGETGEHGVLDRVAADLAAVGAGAAFLPRSNIAAGAFPW